MNLRRAAWRLYTSTSVLVVLVTQAVLVSAAPATGAPDPAPANRPPLEYKLDDVLFTLSRGPCDGDCPVYSVALQGNGAVLYYGEENVDTLGQQIGWVSRDGVVELLNAVYAAGFMDFQDRYLSGRSVRVTDGGIVLIEYTGSAGMQRCILTVTIRDFGKRIVFQSEFAPRELVELADLIDEVSGSQKWLSRGR